MKVVQVVIASIMTLTLLSGCTTTQLGNKNASNLTNIQELVDSHATKKWVYVELGQPHDVIYDEKEQSSSWIFYCFTSSIRGTAFIPVAGIFTPNVSIDGNKLTIFFDEKGKVKRFETLPIKKSFGIVGAIQATWEAESLERSKRVEEEMIYVGVPYDDLKVHKYMGMEVLTDQR